MLTLILFFFQRAGSTDDAAFLQGILEGIADIEARCFALLVEEGCTPVSRVLTCGGGSKNQKWTEMRRRRLGVEVEASFGSASLARRSVAGE